MHFPSSRIRILSDFLHVMCGDFSQIVLVYFLNEVKKHIEGKWLWVPGNKINTLIAQSQKNPLKYVYKAFLDQNHDLKN